MSLCIKYATSIEEQRGIKKKQHWEGKLKDFFFFFLDKDRKKMTK